MSNGEKQSGSFNLFMLAVAAIAICGGPSTTKEMTEMKATTISASQATPWMASEREDAGGGMIVLSGMSVDQSIRLDRAVPRSMFTR